MITSHIDDFFAKAISLGKGLVLAIVCKTRGSTYSKTGNYMLISEDGHFSSLLSGGCLEGDLIEQAKQVLRKGASSIVTYDLSDEDALWGLGAGCNGVMQIYLHPLILSNNYKPFTLMQEYLIEGKPSVLSIIIDSKNKKNLGLNTVIDQKKFIKSGLSDLLSPHANKQIKRSFSTKNSSLLRIDEDNMSILCVILKPMPKILIMGAGRDALPVIKFCQELGWQVTIQDHRSAYIEEINKEMNVMTCNYSVSNFSENIVLNEFVAGIIMTHHFEHDQNYLRALAKTSIPYIGLLGPKERKNNMLLALTEQASSLEGRLYGPAGLKLGGRGPNAIALSIVSQIHQILTNDNLI